MTREEAQDIMPIIQEYINDKEINPPNKNNIMKELEMWLVRDKNNNLCLYDGKSKPIKDNVIEEWIFGDFIGFLPPDYFPEIQWSVAEPTKIKLVLDK